jgi:hypothetical protein
MAPEFNFVQTIPAHPGYYLLGTLLDDHGRPEGLDKEPIVAWAIEEGSYAPYPITCEGVETGNGPVLRPDGTVATAWNERLRCENDWLKSQQQDWDIARGKVRP